MDDENIAQQVALPCPFCGAKPNRHKDEQPGSRWEYACPNGHTRYLRMKEWNTRSVTASDEWKRAWIRSAPTGQAAV